MALVQVPVPQAGMTLLSTTSLSGNVLTVSSISSSYTHLYLRIEGYSFDIADQMALRFNTDTTSNAYSYCYSKVNAATGGADGGRSTQARLNETTVATTVTTNTTYVLIPNYTNTTAHKIAHFISGYKESSASATFLQEGGLYWSNTSAINAITLATVGGNNFDAGNVYIYGVN